MGQGQGPWAEGQGGLSFPRCLSTCSLFRGANPPFPVAAAWRGMALQGDRALRAVGIMLGGMVHNILETGGAGGQPRDQHLYAQPPGPQGWHARPPRPGPGPDGRGGAPAQLRPAVHQRNRGRVACASARPRHRSRSRQVQADSRAGSASTAPRGRRSRSRSSTRRGGRGRASRGESQGPHVQAGGGSSQGRSQQGDPRRASRGRDPDTFGRPQEGDGRVRHRGAHPVGPPAARTSHGPGAAWAQRPRPKMQAGRGRAPPVAAQGPVPQGQSSVSDAAPGRQTQQDQGRRTGAEGEPNGRQSAWRQQGSRGGQNGARRRRKYHRSEGAVRRRGERTEARRQAMQERDEEARRGTSGPRLIRSSASSSSDS